MTQIINGKERPIVFLSRMLGQAELAYYVREKECLALVWAVTKLRYYLLGNHFTIYTDHQSLQYLGKVKDPHRRLARWSLEMSQYNYTIKYIKGKDNTAADGLSRLSAYESDTETAVLMVGGEVEEELGVLDLDRVEMREHLKLAPMVGERNGPVVVADEASVLTEGFGPISHADIVELQARDEWCRSVLEEIERGSQRYVNIDGAIYRLNGGGEKRLVVPEGLRLALLKEKHDSPVAGGHLGLNKLLKGLTLSYYWPHMGRDIEKYHKACNVCSRTKNPPPRQLRLGTVSATAPWEIVAMDILSGLPETARGNKHLLVVGDYFTRFKISIPLPDMKAATVAEALSIHVICKFDVPRSLLTDRGSNFTSEYLKDVCGVLRVKQVWTTA